MMADEHRQTITEHLVSGGICPFRKYRTNVGVWRFFNWLEYLKHNVHTNIIVTTQTRKQLTIYNNKIASGHRSTDNDCSRRLTRWRRKLQAVSTTRINPVNKHRATMTRTMIVWITRAEKLMSPSYGDFYKTSTQPDHRWSPKWGNDW